MVTGLVELIPLFLEVGSKVFNYFGKQKLKKGSRSDFESKLGSVDSILSLMKPLIDGMKQVEGICEWGAFKKLIQTVEDGSQLVLEIKSKSSRDKKKYLNRMEEWMGSFRDSLLLAMFQVHLSNASGQKEIQQQLSLLLNRQTPQMHFHLHLPAPFLAHQQLPLSDELLKDEKYKLAFQKFIDCVNMFGGLDPLLQGLESVSTHKTEDAKELKESRVLQLPENDKEEKLELMNTTGKTSLALGLESVSTLKTEDAKELKEARVLQLPENDKEEKLELVNNTTGKTSMALGTSTKKVATHYQNPESVDNHIVNMVDIEKPKNNTVVQKKVVLAVLARGEAGKKIVEKASRYVKGVISTKRDERPNEATDLVTAIGTKDMNVEDLISYLKNKLSRKHVYIIPDTPFKEE